MSSENGANIEIILKHLMEQQDKYNSTISNRLDKMNMTLDELRDHKGLVLQLDKRMDSAEIHISDIREKVQKLIYDSDKRDEIKKTITNPLIMKAIWAVMGVIGCFMFIAIGFSYKTIDIKSNIELQKLMNR